jgi:signal transduction histidine kinase
VTDDAERRIRLVAALAAGAAHDLRNVLASADSSLFLAERAPALDAARRPIEAARRRVQEAQALIDRALAPARSGDLAKERVALVELVAAARAAAEPPEGATLEIEAPEGLVVEVEPLLFTRVLVTLLDNARDAARSASRPLRVEVRASRSRDGEGAIEVEVEDDGPGVPTELRARLFEPLTTGRAEGTGLGLFAARAILELHGGSIELVEPRTLRGARFLLRLGSPPRPS